MGARPNEERWVDFAIDALHVQRTNVQSEVACWGQALRGSAAGPALAAAVREPATAAGW